jgi:hypothetical protein
MQAVCCRRQRVVAEAVTSKRCGARNYSTVFSPVRVKDIASPSLRS